MTNAMPHDMNGNALAVGDEVIMRFTVTAVSEGETACNVTLVASEGPPEEYKPQIACNSRLTHRLFVHDLPLKIDGAGGGEEQDGGDGAQVSDARAGAAEDSPKMCRNGEQQPKEPPSLADVVQDVFDVGRRDSSSLEMMRAKKGGG